MSFSDWIGIWSLIVGVVGAVVGIIGFISSVYMAIMLNPINIIAGMVVYLICLIIFLRYAPIETMKRPIGNSRKKFFKKITVITATCLFIVAFCIGENVYRNIIIIGISLEAVMILPIMKIIIQ